MRLRTITPPGVSPRAPRAPGGPRRKGPAAAFEVAVAKSVRPQKILSRLIYMAVLGTLVGFGLRFAGAAILFVRAPGVVDLGEVRLSAPAGGRIEEIRVDPGDRVRAGDVLAVVDDAKQTLAAGIAEAEAERLRAEIRRARDAVLAAARRQASDDRSEAARLRDRALRARGEREELEETLRALEGQREEVDQDLEALEHLAVDDVVARAEFLNLRVLHYDLEGRLAGGGKRAASLEEDTRQLETEVARLQRSARGAVADALASSALPGLLAQLEEAQARASLLAAQGRFEVRAPAGGTISWVDHPPGETVAAGEPVLRLIVAGKAPRVVAYAGDNAAKFPEGTRVTVHAAGLKARGAVERTLRADREKPGALLKPYEREVVDPAVLIRVDDVVRGRLRSGAIVEVTRPRWDILQILGE